MLILFLEGVFYVELVLFLECFLFKILGFGSFFFFFSELCGVFVDVVIVQREFGWMLWEGVWLSEEERVDIFLRVLVFGVFFVDVCRRSQLVLLYWVLFCYVWYVFVVVS